MGLDMHLYKRLYTQNWNHTPRERRHRITIERGDYGVSGFDNPTYVIQEHHYWRKFNALHGYIVDTFANGVDKCQEIRLSKSDIEQILDTLTECYKTKDSSLLKPKEGFLFGSTEVDEYYWDCIADSIDSLRILLREIENDSNIDCYYQASW